LRTAAWRISLFGDEIEAIAEFDPLTGQKTGDLKSVKIYANSHYVTPRPTLKPGDQAIREELKHRLAELEAAGRCWKRSGWSSAPGSTWKCSRPPALPGHRELFALSHRPRARRAAADAVRIHPRQRLVFIDESHVSDPADRRHVSRRLPPQGDAGRIRLPAALLHRQPAAALRGMGRDAARRPSPSRPRPAWEMEQAGGVFAEQVIRPTGLIDPPVEVRPARAQVDDVLGEIRATAEGRLPHARARC
jgi:excinuclease ABC subunit B